MDSTNKDLSHSINCSHCSFNRLIPAICNDRICLVCGNDHSFRNNFAGIITSMDLIPKLLPGLFRIGPPIQKE
ncbi:MAG: hypothetical protein ACJ72R_04100 [Nitrososphaeraceae archaeon]